jgi:sporulation protein YlmC with PRC-barrel domain
MLISHVKPSQLWGKKAYDNEGRFLGEVIAVGFRRGVVRRVVVRPEGHGRPIGLLPAPETLVDGQRMLVPVSQPATQTRLRLVH